MIWAAPVVEVKGGVREDRKSVGRAVERGRLECQPWRVRAETNPLKSRLPPETPPFERCGPELVEVAAIRQLLVKRLPVRPHVLEKVFPLNILGNVVSKAASNVDHHVPDGAT